MTETTGSYFTRRSGYSIAFRMLLLNLNFLFINLSSGQGLVGQRQLVESTFPGSLLWKEKLLTEGRGDLF